MYNKVSPKDPLNFPASLYNKLIDIDRENQKEKGFKNIATKHENAYFIQNKSGKKLPIYSILMVTDLALDFPASADNDVNLNFFIGTEIVFKGEIPDKNSIHFNKICILQEPLEIDGVGIGILDGLSKCSIYQNENTNIVKGLALFLSPVDQVTDYLTIANWGTIECLFSQTPKKQELVFGVANLGGSVVSSYFLVDLVWKSGGDSNDAYEARIYDIKLNAEILKADVDVASGDNPYRRPVDYNVTKADIGLAFVGGNGNILIAWCNEYPLLGVAEILP